MGISCRLDGDGDDDAVRQSVFAFFSLSLSLSPCNIWDRSYGCVLFSFDTYKDVGRAGSDWDNCAGMLLRHKFVLWLMVMVMKVWRVVAHIKFNSFVPFHRIHNGWD